MKLVSRPGRIGVSMYFSASVCTPTPHAIDRTASYSSIFSSRGATNSWTHCRCTVTSSTSSSWPSAAAAVRKVAAMALDSFLPPAKQTDTQVPHPTVSTFFLPLSIRWISFSGFCSATIMLSLLRFGSGGIGLSSKFSLFCVNGMLTLGSVTRACAGAD